LKIPDKAPVRPIPIGVLFMCGAHLDRDTRDAVVTVIPIIILTVVSGSELRSQAPIGVNTIPPRARGRKPVNLSLPLEDTSTIVLRAMLDTAITGTAHEAGANRHIRGRARSEYPKPQNPCRMAPAKIMSMVGNSKAVSFEPQDKTIYSNRSKLRLTMLGLPWKKGIK
jgi:hypothetical protein